MEKTLTKKRFGEFEIAKALAIMGLPFVHVMEEMAWEMGYMTEAAESFAEPIVFLSIFGPAIFMICMGFGMSGSYSWKRLLKTGIQFLIIGYAINIICFSVPEAVAYIRGLEDAEFLEMFHDALASDIYIFVGWFYVFYALMKKWKASDFTIFAVTVLLLIVNCFTGYYVYCDTTVLNTFFGNFISLNEYSYFPLAGWAMFPMIGIAIGNFLKKQNPVKYHENMKRIFVSCILALSLVVLGMILYEINPIEVLQAYTDEYLMDVFIALLLILISGIVISGLHLIYHAVRSNALERFLLKISSVIMSFYIIQWLMVAVLTYYIFWQLELDEAIFGVGAAWGIMLGIFALTLFITNKWGFSFMRFVIKKTDYTRWFKKKKKVAKK